MIVQLHDVTSERDLIAQREIEPTDSGALREWVNELKAENFMVSGHIYEVVLERSPYFMVTKA